MQKDKFKALTKLNKAMKQHFYGNSNEDVIKLAIDFSKLCKGELKMSVEQEKLIVRQAIDKAEKNGYKGHTVFLPMMLATHQNSEGKWVRVDDEVLEKIATDTFYYHAREIIFSHAFVKLFFPCDEIDTDRNVIKDHKYHIAMMYKMNPLEYIQKYL